MIKINLIPETGKKHRKKIKGPANFVLMFSVITVTTLVVMGAATLYVKSEVSKLKTQEEENNRKISSLKKDIDEVKKYEALIAELKQRGTIIEELRKNQAVPVKILDEVSSIAPEGVWLTALSYKGNNVNLEGIAFTNDDIVAYIENLKRSGDMADVYLEESRESEIEKVKVYRFKLKFNVKA